MKNNFEQCMALVLKEEGGYVDNLKDPGGPTNLGVTQKIWENWVGHYVSKGDMMALTVEDVLPLYKANYWNEINGDLLPLGVDYAVFDMAVNNGVARAAKILQRVLGVNADGKIGPVTINACEVENSREIATRFCEARLAYLQGRPTYATFEHGFNNRIAFVEKTAFEMAS